MARKKVDINEGDRIKDKRKAVFRVEDAFSWDKNNKKEEKTESFVKIPEGREPVVPGIPCQTGHARFITAELWVIIRCLAEGRRLGFEGISCLTGVRVDQIADRSRREGWITPKKIRAANLKEVERVLGEIFASAEDTVKKEIAWFEKKSDEESDEDGVEFGEGEEMIAIDGVSGTDLRAYIETPAKFRPKKSDLIGAGKTPDEKLKELSALRADMKSELAKRSDLHQIMVSEVTQATMMHVVEKVKEDPSLGLLFAREIESVNKTARTNYKLDAVELSVGGAQAVLLMSDPGFIPKPAITKTIDAELVEEAGDEDEDSDSREEVISNEY